MAKKYSYSQSENKTLTDENASLGSLQLCIKPHAKNLLAFFFFVWILLSDLINLKAQLWKPIFLQLRAMAKVAVSNLASTYAGFHLTISGLLWLCHNIVTIHSQSKTLRFGKRKKNRISIVLTSFRLFIHKRLKALAHNCNFLCHCSTNRPLRTSDLGHLAVAAPRLQNDIHH